MTIRIQYTSGKTISVTTGTINPGSGATWSIEPYIDWGDGSTTTSLASNTTYYHTYADYGTYTISTSGTNDCGGTASDTKSITLVESRLPPCNAPDGIGYGDIDGDGYVTEDDATMVENYAIGKSGSELTDAQIIRADVDGDGEVTITDAILIGKYATYVEGYDTFPVCEVCPVPECSFTIDEN